MKEKITSSDSYCLSYCRSKLKLLPLGILLTVCAVLCLSLSLFLLLREKNVLLWILLVLSLAAGVALGIPGILRCYTAFRDGVHPEHSALAESIRAQLPHPETAPMDCSLFQPVDQDIADNGVFLGSTAAGKSWLIQGDTAFALSRLRGAFSRTEGLNTFGRMENGPRAYLLDARRTPTEFIFLSTEQLAAFMGHLRDCVPDAIYGDWDAYKAAMALTDDAWDRKNLDFQVRQRDRDQNSSSTGNPSYGLPVLLTCPQETAPQAASPELIRKMLSCVPGSQPIVFTLTASSYPVRYRLLQCVLVSPAGAAEAGQAEEEKETKKETAPAPGGRADEGAAPECCLCTVPVPPAGFQDYKLLWTKTTRPQAEQMLLNWLQGTMPDFTGWTAAPLSAMPPETRTPLLLPFLQAAV